MSLSYLTEAFKSLEILEEEDFNLADKQDIEKLQDFENDEPEDTIEIMSMDFDDIEDSEEEDLEESHVGDVILDCPVCHSKLYKNADEVVIDEEEQLANVGEECPYCFTSDGFKIIGQVAPYKPEDEVKVEVEDKIEDDNGEEVKEEEKEEVEVKESLTESKEVDLTEYQKWVDYDMKKYHKISKNTMDKIKSAGLSVVKDQYGDYEVIADRADSDAKNESLNTKLTEKQWQYTLKSGSLLRDAIENGDLQQVQDALVDCYNELHDHDLLDDGEWDSYIEDVQMIDAEDEDAEDEFDYQLNEFYDLCDNLNVWVALSESLKEDLEKVELETENQRITIKSEPKEEEPGEQMIAPIEPEVKAEIEDNVEVEEEPEEESEIDFDVDEFDEESFDEIGESYLRKVYENVNSYKTTKVMVPPTNHNQLIIEGVIKFNSGKEKKTSFIFESKDATKNGSLRFIGENKQISRGKKSFILKGSLNEGKFLSESLNYNYRTKDASGKSTRIYGTAKKS